MQWTAVFKITQSSTNGQVLFFIKKSLGFGHAFEDWFDKGVKLAAESIAQPSMSPVATTSPDAASEPELSTKANLLQSSPAKEAVTPASQNREEEMASPRSVSSAYPILDVGACDNPVPAYQAGLGIEDPEELDLVQDQSSSTHDADLGFLLDGDPLWSLHEPIAIDPVLIILNHYFQSSAA